MERRQLFTHAALAGIAISPGCALIFSGAKAPEDRDHSRILWGWLIMDILFTGFIGLIIDLATGAIYARKGDVVAAAGMARAVRLCAHAETAVVELRRPHQVGRYMADHLPTCPTCSASLASLTEGDVDVASLCVGSGEVVTQPFQTALAPPFGAPA